MRVLAPRRTIRLLSTSLLTAALASPGAALEVRTYMDSDNNPATGCTAMTAAGAVGGMEHVLVATLDTTVNPHVLTSLSRAVCSGGGFGAAIPVALPYPAPWVAGDRNGAEGADVVEMYIPRSALSNAYTVRLAFAASQGAEADALLTTGGGAGDPPILFQLGEPIPMLSGVAVALLVLLLGIAGALLGRRAGAAALALALLGAIAGLAWGAMLLDGDPGDWQAGACLAYDPVADAAPGVDIAAAHVSADDELVWVRVDAGRNAAPVAVDDQASTTASSGVGGNVLAANPTTPDIDPDLDTLTVTELNGSGAAIGSQQTLPSGALLTLAADGAFAYDPNGRFAPSCPGDSATDTFTYTVGDGHGASDGATVTVTIHGDPENEAIAIEKLVNGQDADTPPGPSLRAGDPVFWSYVVTNTGAATLSQVSVSDDHGVAVSCPKTTLQPGESMTCTGSGAVATGPYSNTGTVSGTTPCGVAVSDTDPAHYFGEGCLFGTDCVSGFCADGVCCDTACNTLCQACTAVKKNGGADGTCGNIPATLDPDNECPGATLCSGSGTCSLFADGTPCTIDGECSSGNCDGTCQAASCGDSIVQEGEDCDDGGETATCDADCSAVSCGDGTVNVTAGEDCEGGSPDICTAGCQYTGCAPDPVALAMAVCMASYSNCVVVDGGIVGYAPPSCTGCNCGSPAEPWRFYCTETSDASNYNCSACTVGQILGPHDPCSCNAGTSPSLGSFCTP